MPPSTHAVSEQAPAGTATSGRRQTITRLAADRLNAAPSGLLVSSDSAPIVYCKLLLSTNDHVVQVPGNGITSHVDLPRIVLCRLDSVDAIVLLYRRDESGMGNQVEKDGLAVLAGDSSVRLCDFILLALARWAWHLKFDDNLFDIWAASTVIVAPIVWAARHSLIGAFRWRR